MEQSILKSTKKILGVGPDDDSFDLDIMTHINSAFSVLTDMGVGPREGFAIEDATSKWENFFELGTNIHWMSQVKNIVYLHSRLLFDPPTSGFLLEAMNKQLEEAKVRLSMNREALMWRDPETGHGNLIVSSDEEFDVIDVEGGGADG